MIRKIKLFKNYFFNFFRYFRILISLFIRIRAKCKDSDNENLVITNKKKSYNNLSARSLPKIIWLYWHDNPPISVVICVKMVRKLNPDWTVNFLNHSTVKNFIDIEFDSFDSIENSTHQQKSDIIRFELLYKYGGIWLDSSVLTFSSFNKFKVDIENENVDILGYYRLTNISVKDSPFMENWFIVAFKNSPSILAWKTEFYHAINMGVVNYINKTKIDNPKFLGNLYDPYYLVCYVCFKNVEPNLLSYKLYDCDSSAFLYHVTGSFRYFLFGKKIWGKYNLIRNVFVNIKPDFMPDMIKLTSGDRYIFEKFYSKKYFLNKSIAEIIFNFLK